MSFVVAPLAMLPLVGSGANASDAVRHREASAHAADVKPSSTSLIVGAKIKLPAVLYDVGPIGSDPMISTAQARSVATAMWRSWQTALDVSDTRALTELAAPGSMLNGTIYSCATPSGRCLIGTSHPPMGELQVIVPVQHSYPLYFLASVRTTTSIENNNGIYQVGPWMNIQILTKASSATPWRLSFDTGYSQADRSQPPFLPFALGAGPDQTYNPVATSSPPIPSEDFLSQLAALWQSYKVVGQAPTDSIFVRGGYATGFGQQLAMDRQNSTFNGTRRHYEFSVDKSAGTWVFTVSGGYPMVCGSVVDNYVVTPVSGQLFQNSDESNWGVPLVPGLYSRIVTRSDHEECAYVIQGGLDVVGDVQYDSSISGALLSHVGTGASKHAMLNDLETAFGVLSNAMGTLGQKYTSCVSAKKTSCEKTFALSAAVLFADFDDNLLNLTFPAKFSTDVASLEKTTRTINGLFEDIFHGKGTATTTTAIKNQEDVLVRVYKKLVTELSVP